MVQRAAFGRGSWQSTTSPALVNPTPSTTKIIGRWFSPVDRLFRSELNDSRSDPL
jgi:hypothetical protein